MNTLRRQSTLTALLFLAPFLLTIAVFFAYAFVRVVYWSFTNYDLFHAPQLRGLKNYADMLGDPSFRTALTNTLLFSVITTVTQTVLALLVANLLNRRLRGISFFRAAWYMPSVTSSVVIGLIFLWLFQRRGIVNYVLAQFEAYRAVILAFVLILVAVQVAQVLFERARGLPAGWTDPALAAISALVAALGTWLLSSFGAAPVYPAQPLDISWYATTGKLLGVLPIPLATIIIQNVFTTVPSLMIFFLAGLQNIPRGLYEAAEIDGAGKVQQLLYVTVPMLRPVTFYVVTVSLIGTLQMFDQVAIIGSAAPLQSTITLAFYVFRNAFSGGVSSAGIASAAAIVLLLITLLFVWVQRRFFVSDEAYT